MGVTALALLASASLGLTACTDSGIAMGSDEVNSVDAALAGTIDETIASAMQLSGSTSAVVGVWTPSGAYVHGYGDGISASSPIRAAQASQPVMCAALLDLVADGKLELDRKVSKDLPRQVGIDGITYGQLCDASSGLADFKADISSIFVNNPTRGWSDRELLAHALPHSPLAEPGTQQQVSDSGALLLARALGQVTKASTPEMLEDRVFGPAKMSRSFYPTELLRASELPSGGLSGLTYGLSAGAPVCSVPGEAEGETVPVDPTPVPAVSPSMLSGAGATVTTVTDLKQFYESYLRGDFGGEQGAALITEPWAAPEAETETDEEAPAEGEEAATPLSNWTFGLEKQGPFYGMAGAITGTITAAYHDPASGFSVVVSLNNSSAGAGFARVLALQLAALSGAGVEWTAEDQAAALGELAVCQPAPEPEAAPEGESEEG